MVVRRSRTIRIHPEIAQRLENLMGDGESYERVLERILEHYESCPRERCPRKG